MDLNENTLFGLAISVVILGLGISMFFIRNYVGYGAIVLAIGLMTSALIIANGPKKVRQTRNDSTFQSENAHPIIVDLTATEPITGSPQIMEDITTQDTQTADVAQSRQSEEPIASETTQEPQSNPEEPKKEEDPIAATPS